LGFGVVLLHPGGAFFGTSTNVFLLGKAEMAVEIRQVFRRRVATFGGFAVSGAICTEARTARRAVPPIHLLM